MFVVRVVAALLIAALILVIVFLFTRNRRYLQWAWWLFLAALVTMLGLMTFYFVERLFLTAAPPWIDAVRSS